MKASNNKKEYLEQYTHYIRLQAYWLDKNQYLKAFRAFQKAEGYLEKLREQTQQEIFSNYVDKR